MTRLMRLNWPGFRSVRVAAVGGYALLGALIVPGQTPPMRSITEGVKTVQQAACGQQLQGAMRGVSR